MDYYNDYIIESLENLESKLSSGCVINQDVRIRGEFPSLGKLKKNVTYLFFPFYLEFIFQRIFHKIISDFRNHK
jgi:hypothetical protein